MSKRPDGGHVLNLVEEGTWDHEDIDENLRRVQERPYNCIEALVDGVGSGAVSGKHRPGWGYPARLQRSTK
ncbi:MAG: hypothetical protein ABF384_17095 [Verrucomicrobiales bacterium]